VKTAATAAFGRFVWALVHAMKKDESELSHAKTKDAEDDSKGIWDWQPPATDSMASGAWVVLRELVLTSNALQASYPEVAELMATPELQPSELVARLYYVYISHEGRGPLEEDGSGRAALPEDSASPPHEVLSLLRRYRLLACLAYDKTDDVSLSDALVQEGYGLLAAQYAPDISRGCPAYYLALADSDSSSSPEKEVLLCIRGTYSAEDVFTDLLAVGSSFGETGHKAHAGIAKAAGFLSAKFGTLLRALYDAGLTVTLVGHSLGAGVASLLALFLHQQGLEPGRLRCLAYEPPACMDLPLAQACGKDNLVMSLVTRDDLVPRMSPEPFISLLKELAAFDWREHAAKEGQEMPAALAVMQKLSELFGSGKGGSVGAGGQGEEGSDDEKSASADQMGYNPYVPGNIMFLCFPPQDQDQSEVVRAMIPPTSPVLRRIRVTSKMLNDHFIDNASTIAALES